jgi:hypothetical protein
MGIYCWFKLVQLLSQHIAKVLPNLRNQIRRKIKEKQEELGIYGGENV